MTNFILSDLKSIDKLVEEMYKQRKDKDGNVLPFTEEEIKRTTILLNDYNKEWIKMNAKDKSKYDNSVHNFMSSKIEDDGITMHSQLSNKATKGHMDAQRHLDKLKKEGKNESLGHNFTETAKDIAKATVSLYAVGRAITFATSSYYELEKSLYSLGVVGGATKTTIDQLRNDLLKMSEDSVYSAKELTESLDQIVKTGKTLEDAKRIVKETEKLATASFESLEFATSSVNKAMIAFEISSSRSAEIVQQYYNAAAATPLSLRSLDESLRNAASAFASIGEFTNRSGEELEDYKVAINGTAAALTGRHNAPYKC